MRDGELRQAEARHHLALSPSRGNPCCARGEPAGVPGQRDREQHPRVLERAAEYGFEEEPSEERARRCPPFSTAAGSARRRRASHGSTRASPRRPRWSRRRPSSRLETAASPGLPVVATVCGAVTVGIAADGGGVGCAEILDGWRGYRCGGSPGARAGAAVAACVAPRAPRVPPGVRFSGSDMRPGVAWWAPDGRSWTGAGRDRFKWPTPRAGSALRQRGAS